MIEEDVRDVLETPELDEPGEQLPGDDGLDARDDEIEDLEQAEPVVEDDEE